MDGISGEKMSAAVSECFPFLHLHGVYIVFTEEDRTETKGKGGVTRGRRRNSLVKDFKWNDEKKLEGRTG